MIKKTYLVSLLDVVPDTLHRFIRLDDFRFPLSLVSPWSSTHRLPQSWSRYKGPVCSKRSYTVIVLRTLFVDELRETNFTIPQLRGHTLKLPRMGRRDAWSLQYVDL